MKRLLPLALLLAIGLGPAGSQAVRAGPKIGVLLKGHTDFWAAVEKGARDAARKDGADLIVRMPPLESDIGPQIQMLDAMAKEGIQALVIAPCSTTALAAPVAAVEAKGIRLVVIDTPIDGDMPVFVGTNQTDAGAAAGKLLASLVGDSDDVSILRYLQTSGATTLREFSAYAELRRAHPGLVIHRDIYSGAGGGHDIDKARLLLREHPGTKAILASSTPGSMAMLQALQESGRAGSIAFVGFGFNLNATVASAIDSGAMAAWIAQLPDQIGGRGVDAAVALLKGETVPEVSFCDFKVITKDNLHDPAVQALLPR